MVWSEWPIVKPQIIPQGDEFCSSRRAAQLSFNPHQNFTHNILQWFAVNGRKDLPWQQQVTPYRVWVSEVMLQQTQVSTVIPYFGKFMLNFPDITSLANADEDKVLSLWSGLGYYARARNLQKSANIISDLFGGIFPTKFDDLLSLPGIGKSTAGAIMALAYHQSYAIMDGNVKRVLSRVYAVAGWSGQAEIAKQLWQLAEHHTPEENVANYTQAMMDLGATLCTRSRPGCLKCPVADDCLAFQQGETTKYPMSKPKVKKQVRTFRFLIMAEQNENHLILLEKRPPTGIWGGLWSFPECLVDDDIDCYCKEKHHVEVLLKKELPMMVHQLTHFTFNIIPVYLKVNRLLTHVSDPSAEWVNIVDISSLGISKPVEKLIRLIYFGNSQ